MQKSHVFRLWHNAQSKVLRCFGQGLRYFANAKENQVMLDAQELAKRLRAAMDLREPPLSSTGLATICGVSKQAVYEWRTTGRIGKQHLLAIAAATGMPLAYYLEIERGQSAETKKIWSRLGKAFAKAALIAAAVIASPQKPAEASFNITPENRSLTSVIHIAWRRLLSLCMHLLHRWRFPDKNLSQCGIFAAP